MRTSIARRLAIGVATVGIAALAARPAPAQVVFTGEIEKATLASFCQEETHVLECAGVLLKSSALDLAAFEGKVFEFTAEARGVECLIYDVTAVESASAHLVRCGNPVPGCPMRFRVGPTGVIGQYWLWLALSPTFLPLDQVTGTWMLNPPFFLLGSGLTFGDGSAVDIVLPPDPSLTGLTLFLQGARQDIGPIGPIELTNPLCFQILGPSPPCFEPDC
jgi:hypothetical protein